MKFYNLTEFIEKINELKSCCGYDDAESNLRVGDVDIEKGLKCLKKISRQTNQEIYLHVDFVNFKRLIYCCLILIKHSICKLDFSKKSSKLAVIKIQTSFCLLLFAFPHERTEEIIGITLKFMDEENIWNYEAVSIDIFQCLLTSCECAEEIFHKILDRIDVMVSESLIDEAQCCARILYSIININFTELSRYALMRLIKFYHASIKTEIQLLRIGFKVALMRLFRFIKTEIMNEILPEILEIAVRMEYNIYLKEFGVVIQKGIAELSNNAIAKYLRPNVMDKIYYMMTSKCVNSTLIACNILTTLIDHYRNSDLFQLPMIFFLFTNYGLKKGNEKDKAVAIIFDEHSEKLEESLVRAVELHGDNYELILSIYKLLCVMITSLPSAKINIMIVKILLKFQSFALEEAIFEEDKRNCIHVMIISIMTLICHISRANSLSAYIHNIVCLRFDKARHLNPPFKMRRPEDEIYLGSELFLDKWDLRHYLWKRYKSGDILRSQAFESLSLV